MSLRLSLEPHYQKFLKDVGLERNKEIQGMADLSNELKTVLTKSSKDEYLHNETLSYEMLLDSHKAIEGLEGFEDLNGSGIEVLAAIKESLTQAQFADSVYNLSQITQSANSSDKLSQASDRPESSDSTSTLDLQTKSNNSASDDWSELEAPNVDLKPLLKGSGTSF